jgi:hypothetical protein
MAKALRESTLPPEERCQELEKKEQRKAAQASTAAEKQAEGYARLLRDMGELLRAPSHPGGGAQAADVTSAAHQLQAGIPD